MARNAGIVIQNKFTKGLVTEFTALNFPENAATEAWNVIFDYTGKVTRRNAFDLESNYATTTQTFSSSTAYTEFIWGSAGGNGEVRLFVQQHGDTLHFYDVSTSVNVSENKKTFTVDLSTYLPTDSSRDPGEFPCQYTVGFGDLIVVNPACNPIFIQYAIGTDSISVTEINLEYRDFDGVQDGLAPSTRPTSTVADLKTNNPKHYYNLLNQGWHVGDALTQWDTALTSLPSNNDYVATFRASDTDAFDENRVTSRTGGNSPAPKGHFILEVGNVDRNTAMTAAGFTGAEIDDSTVNTTQSDGAVIGDYTLDSNAFDNVISGSFAYNATTAGYIGKDFSSLDVKVNGASFYAPSVGFLEYSDTDTITFQLYAKATGTPANSTDGTLLGSKTLTATDTGVSNSLGTPIGTLSPLEDAFDGDNGTYTSNNTSGAEYVGKSYDFPVQVNSAVISPADVGDPWYNDLDLDETITFRLYGKSGVAPASSTDGDLLGTTSLTSSSLSVNSSTGTLISFNRHNFSNKDKAFDGNNSTLATFNYNSSGNTFKNIGKNFSSVGGARVSSVDIRISGNSWLSSGDNVSFRLYGKTGSAAPNIGVNGVPTNADFLGSTSLFDGSTSTNQTITSFDNTTKYNYIFVTMVATLPNSSGTARLGEVVFDATYDEFSSANQTITSSDTTTFYDHVWVRYINSSSTEHLLRVNNQTFNLNRKVFSTGVQTITSSDTTTDFDSVWLRTTHSSPTSGNETRLSEVYFNSTYTATDSTGATGTDEKTDERPSTAAFFSGRMWYAGIGAGKLSSTVFFSQSVVRREQYEKCYQQNDPTSEYFSDLLPSDGGLITIPEAGVINKLFALKTAILVFATNGVWLISGQNGRAFSADNYQVKKVSSLGNTSPISFIDYKGYPMWWGEDGIFYVFFDPQFETYEVQSITDETIKSFFLEIPSRNRKFVKGAYNVNDDIIQWLYNDDETQAVEDSYTYTKTLNFSGRNQAFYPWSIDTTSVPDIRGIAYVFDREGTDLPILKYTTTINVDATNQKLTYSDTTTNTFLDWSRYDEFEGVDDGTEIKDYESYFITAYRPDGETQKLIDSNYVYVFLNQDDDSSLYVQGVFDYSANSNSGKQSPFQQCYNINRLNRIINYRKLRVRGTGRAIQLKFKSETGKPFSLVGWSIFETTQGNP